MPLECAREAARAPAEHRSSADAGACAKARGLGRAVEAALKEVATGRKAERRSAAGVGQCTEASASVEVPRQQSPERDPSAPE